MERRERYEPMEYKNQQLMTALNEWCICLKVWLYPERFGDRLSELQQRYPKPDIIDIDLSHHLLHEALRKDANPLIRR